MLQDPMLGSLLVPAQSSQLPVVRSDLQSEAVVDGEEKTFCEQTSRSGFSVGCSVCCLLSAKSIGSIAKLR